MKHLLLPFLMCVSILFCSFSPIAHHGESNAHGSASHVESGLVFASVDNSAVASIDNLLLSYSMLVVLIIALTQAAKKALNKMPSTPNWAVRFLSQTLGISLVLVLSFLEISILADLSLISSSAVGLIAAITANGLYDTEIVRRIMSKFKN